MSLPLQCHEMVILKVLKWYTCHREDELNFKHLSNHVDLEILSNDIFSLVKGSSRTLLFIVLCALTKLKTIYFKALPFKGLIFGLDNLISLEILVFKLHGRIIALYGLSAFKNLHLCVSKTKVNHLTWLDKLSKLHEL